MHRGAGIASTQRETPRRRQVRAGLLGELQRPRVRRAQIRAIAVGLLEVVADDLVQLARLDEPGGEAFVQLGASLLRQRGIGRLADQGMAEAEGLLAGDRAALRADQLLAGSVTSRAPTKSRSSGTMAP